MTNPIIKYAPGSEWLYVKCYGGPQTLEEWLVTRLRLLIGGWYSDGITDLFYFVRFLDPDYHIRLRFRLNDPSKASVILNAINQTLREQMALDLVWKLEVSTYEPEIERYGIERIAFVELFFNSDSDFWLEVLAQNGLDEDYPVWKIVMISIHRLLTDLKVESQDRINILERLRSSLNQEFGFGRSFKTQLDDKYRKLQPEINDLLSPGPNIWDVELSRRSLAYRGPFIRILDTFPGHESLVEGTLIPDLIHMSINRAFRTRHKLQELVVYDFLGRHYQSMLARNKGKME